MMRLHHLVLGLAVAVVLAGCETNEKNFPNFEFAGKTPEGIKKCPMA